MNGRESGGRGSVGLRGAGPTRLRGEGSRVEERSSIWASLLSQAEEPFLGEVGTAELTRAGLPNNKKGEKVG
jgi:hypothetical protein